MNKFVYQRTGNKVTLVVSGDLGDVIAEIGYIIHRIHAGLLENAPEAAKEFRKGIIQVVCDPECEIWEKQKRPRAK